MERRPRRIAAEMAFTGGLSTVMMAMPLSTARLMGWLKAWTPGDIIL
jgi:hypothetical protein